MKTLFTIALFFILHSGFVQAQTDSILNNQLKLTKQYLEKKDYVTANEQLKKIFASKKSLPDEVAFLYAKTQLGLNNYVKARDGFQKYLDLTGNQGAYLQEAIVLKADAESHICRKCGNTGIVHYSDTCKVCSGLGNLKEDCKICKGKAVQLCYNCRGAGVTTVQGPFGSLYQSCSICAGKGLSDCRNCKGTGKHDKFCESCKGMGFFKKKEICIH